MGGNVVGDKLDGRLSSGGRCRDCVYGGCVSVVVIDGCGCCVRLSDGGVDNGDIMGGGVGVVANGAKWWAKCWDCMGGGVVVAVNGAI